MTTRRSNGEGSVFYRQDRDKWSAQIFDPLTGKTMTRSARTKADANRLLREMRNRIDDGAPAADTPLTLERWCATWLETRVGKRRSPGTVNQYANRMRRYVLPYLGRRRMDQITAPMIEDTWDQLAARGLSYSTIKNAHNALSACLHDAVRENRLGVNPTQRASLPTNAAPAKRPAPPSSNEVHDLITTALETDPPVGRLVQLVAYTGCRPGEACAAKWSDIDLDAGTWRVSRTLTHNEQGRVIIGDTTKTKQERVIPLAPEVVESLRKQRTYVAELRLQAYRWDDLDLVFPNTVGKWLDVSNTRRHLKRATGHDVTWRQLRHHAATVTIANAPLPVASKLLGHKKISTTVDVYGHLMEADSRAAMDALRDAISG